MIGCKKAILFFNKCLQAYDENREQHWGVLFKRSFENRVCSLLRLQQAQKRKAQLNSSSLEEKFLMKDQIFSRSK